MSEEKRTASEQDYIEEMARHMLTHVWAKEQVQRGSLAAITLEEPFAAAAVEKGWISLKSVSLPRVLAKGFSAAAAYLRR